jgi:hypothetical protein
MILASADLGAATVTEVFRVGNQNVVEQVIFCNRAGSDTTIRCWLVPHDTERGDEHAWFYNQALVASTTLLKDLNSVRMTLGERIFAYAAASSVSVNVVGY